MIKNVEVIKWCISCKNCETVCPWVFKVAPKSKVITSDFTWMDSEILMAEAMCPVNVIKVQKEWKFTLSFKTWKIISKKMLTPDTLELKISTNHFSFKPGQYVSIQMKDAYGKFSRSYSIADANESYFVLTVKLLKKWRGANFLKKIKLQKNIHYLGWIWNFVLQNTNKNKTFIATGTWLAPMISMIKNTPSEIKKTVIFWVRFEKDIYYKEILESFPNTKVIITASRPSEFYKWNKWRVVDYLNEVQLEDEVYICWNPQMIASVRECLLDKGHSWELIFNEAFTISKKYPWFIKDLFINWNIPYLEVFSWIIMAISIIFLPIFYSKIDTNLLWDISWWAVVFVMLIRPLSDLTPRLWILFRLNHLRRAFWILSAMVVVTALWYKFYWSSDFLFNYFWVENWSNWQKVLSRLSELTAIILLLTSNDLSQKILWWSWKKIQRLSYIYFISWWIIAAIYAPLKIYPAMFLVILIWLLAELRVRLRK